MPQLMDLLQEWEDRLEMGDPVTPEELCMNQTDVDLSTLRQHIDKLQKLNRVLEVGPDDKATASAFSPDKTEIPAELTGYEIKESLGDSGMGVVVLAYQIELKRNVAIKFLPKMANANRFLREAQVLALLNHPNIVPIYHSQLRNDNPHFVMEYITGGNLADRVSVLAKQPIADVVRLMIKVANAVHFAHQQGVIHRDLKPANILLDDEGEPRVTDFGLAKLLGNTEEPEVQVGNDTIPNSTSLTRTGAQVGTPSYMAPEQYVADKMTQQVDIWALGVILYECLTGNRPFQGKHFEQLQPQVLFLEPPSMRSIRKEIPVALEKIVQKCMKKSPSERYQSAAELVKDLERLQQPGRHIAKLGLAAAAILLVAGTIVYLASGKLVQIAATIHSNPIQSSATVSEPLPELTPGKAHYLKAVEPLLQQLKRGEKVELVKPGEKLRGYLLREGIGPRINNRADDGSLTVLHSNFCFLELLPKVDCERYRITSKYRHDYQSGVDGQVGIYHCYQQSSNPQGMLHCVSLQSIIDPVQRHKLIPSTKPLFRSSLFGFMDHSGQIHRFTPDKPEFEKILNEQSAKWHTVQIDVDHSDISTVFDGKPLGTFKLTERELAFQMQGPSKDPILGLQSKDFRFPPHGAIGICIVQGAISVQSFTVEPLP